MQNSAMIRNLLLVAIFGSFVCLRAQANDGMDGLIRDIEDCKHQIESLKDRDCENPNRIHDKAVDTMKAVLKDRIDALEAKKPILAKGDSAIAKYDRETMAPIDDRMDKARCALDMSGQAGYLMNPDEWIQKRLENAKKEKDLQPFVEQFEKRRNDALQSINDLVDAAAKNVDWDKFLKARYAAESAALRREYAERLFHAKCDEFHLAKRVARKGTNEQRETFKKMQEKTDAWFKAWDNAIDDQRKELKLRYERELMRKTVENGLGW